MHSVSVLPLQLSVPCFQFLSLTPQHEHLFVFKDTNARTGRREKGGVASKDNKLSVPTAKTPSMTAENYC